MAVLYAALEIWSSCFISFLSKYSCFVGDKYMPFLTNGRGSYINAVFVDVGASF